ncbi:MAG: ribosomal RNA small subunit methyltransferase A [Bdellovibrionaceae bacterium]|nr:ribosomal RNA small subunit methyltransferase A [Pseudobdellovibrionaceae bacterium]
MSKARERLKTVREELGIHAKRSLGQNFLVSDHVIEKIVNAGAGFQPTTIIEVGPGCGALTWELKEVCERLQLIELDHELAEYWRGKNFDVIETDALKWSWDLAEFPGRKVFVSNLPYQISSSILVERSIDKVPLSGMVLMFQKEVAQRIKAKVGAEDYGFLSVLAQTFWDVELLLEAGPRDFDPAPRIASRVLTFNPRQVQVADRPKYLKFLKACFLHPRKIMISSLMEGLGRPREELTAALEKRGLDPKIRAGELRLQQFLDLYRELGMEQNS